MENNVILKKIEEYSMLLDCKEELTNLTTKNNKAIQKCRDELAEMMINNETPQLVHNGYSYSLQNKVKWNKAGGMDEALFEGLRSLDLGDLIKETVNASILTAAVNNLLDESGDEQLPAELEGCLTRYEFNEVARRKSRKGAKQNGRTDF